jgi:hypothetical protein
VRSVTHPSSSSELNLERIQAVIAAIASTAPRDQDCDVATGLDELALDVIKPTGLTLAEFTEVNDDRL